MAHSKGQPRTASSCTVEGEGKDELGHYDQTMPEGDGDGELGKLLEFKTLYPPYFYL